MSRFLKSHVNLLMSFSLVAMCLPEIRQTPSRESWWDDGVPGTDPLPVPEPDFV